MLETLSFQFILTSQDFLLSTTYVVYVSQYLSDVRGRPAGRFWPYLCENQCKPSCHGL